MLVRGIDLFHVAVAINAQPMLNSKPEWTMCEKSILLS